MRRVERLRKVSWSKGFKQWTKLSPLFIVVFLISFFIPSIEIPLDFAITGSPETISLDVLLRRLAYLAAVGTFLLSLYNTVEDDSEMDSNRDEVTEVSGGEGNQINIRGDIGQGAQINVRTTESKKEEGSRPQSQEIDVAENFDQHSIEKEVTTKNSDQPKIREVKDNFGHTFTFGSDTSGHVSVDDEIILTDDTEVQLCVTKVAKKEDDELTYSYWFGNQKADHPDNTAGDARIEDNCWTWSMQRDDYASRWSFKIWIRNQDDIYYQNNAVDSDYRVEIHYTNIVLKQ